MTEQTPTADPMTLTWTVDMTTVIGMRWEWDQDGESRHEVKETLGDRVAELLADRIYQARRHDDEYWSSRAVKEAVDRAISERVEAAMTRSVTPTDEFGQPKGAPTTMGDIITGRLSAWFKENAPSRDSYSSYGSRQTNLQALLDDAVKKGIREDADKAVKAAKAEIVSVLQKQAAQVMTEMMARAVGAK